MATFPFTSHSLIGFGPPPEVVAVKVICVLVHTTESGLTVMEAVGTKLVIKLVITGLEVATQPLSWLASTAYR